MDINILDIINTNQQKLEQFIVLVKDDPNWVSKLRDKIESYSIEWLVRETKVFGPSEEKQLKEYIFRINGDYSFDDIRSRRDSFFSPTLARIFKRNSKMFAEITLAKFLINGLSDNQIRNLIPNHLVSNNKIKLSRKLLKKTKIPYNDVDFAQGIELMIIIYKSDSYQSVEEIMNKMFEELLPGTSVDQPQHECSMLCRQLSEAMANSELPLSKWTGTKVAEFIAKSGAPRHSAKDLYRVTREAKRLAQGILKKPL